MGASTGRTSSRRCEGVGDGDATQRLTQALHHSWPAPRRVTTHLRNREHSEQRAAPYDSLETYKNATRDVSVSRGARWRPTPTTMRVTASTRCGWRTTTFVVVSTTSASPYAPACSRRTRTTRCVKATRRAAPSDDDRDVTRPRPRRQPYAKLTPLSPHQRPPCHKRRCGTSNAAR